MPKDTNATDTSSSQEGHNYGGNAYYKDDDSIPTMNTVGYVSSSRSSSSSSNIRSHHITNAQVVDATDNESLASGITLESFQ